MKRTRGPRPASRRLSPGAAAAPADLTAGGPWRHGAVCLESGRRLAQAHGRGIFIRGLCNVRVSSARWGLPGTYFENIDFGGKAITVRSDVLVVGGLIPPSPPGPYSIPMQAVIGESLTNLWVLDVQ